MQEVLYRSKFCGAFNRSILNAAAGLRDLTASAEITNQPLCIVSLEFQADFDNVSHD
jgi:hypothetical protein